MAISDAKILESERNAVYVKSNVGTRLTGTVEQNKNAFDKFPQLNMDKHNSLIDLLTALGLDNITTDFSNRYTKTEADTKISEETVDLVKTIEFTKEDGKFKITTKGGTVTVLDTDLEKIPASLTLETEGDVTYLVITNQDGTTTRTDVTSLLNVYAFEDSESIGFTEDPNYHVTAILKPNSVKPEHMSFSMVDEIEKYVADAASSATAAASSATASETSANNANTFMMSAEEYRDEAETAKTAAETARANAEASEMNASASADTAMQMAIISQSYAKGDTGEREGEDTDNSKYYMEQAQLAALQAAGFDYKGAWDATVSYTQYQLVSYDSTLWTAVNNNINSIPYEGSSDWAIFISVPSVLDLGGFTDDTLAAHIANLNAHSTMAVDANATEATTEETLLEHETSTTAHGNITIDGGGSN